ncbi:MULTISPECIES: hypothetical protein [unclassified Microbacterium]|uniref:hypothetical protein n=1 Tax=unclassified Microbacterium TaxID=2609290 RepID=UPI000EAA18A7|nr:MULTISPECIES: hypothetical protein [unclassified Microbacterium]MBT2484788.1 hypothetical protein [Microbacterium sp. ISL-108]RKN67664.1 hypothetical protein D7252_08755 [Microbacterium sp. CGR2]
MSYRDTARAFATASATEERWSPQAHWLDSITRGTPSHDATGYDPNATARAYGRHVEKLAADLREALSDDAQEKPLRAYAVTLEDAARALLAAIGEDA